MAVAIAVLMTFLWKIITVAQTLKLMQRFVSDHDLMISNIFGTKPHRN